TLPQGLYAEFRSSRSPSLTSKAAGAVGLADRQFTSECEIDRLPRHGDQASALRRLTDFNFTAGKNGGAQTAVHFHQFVEADSTRASTRLAEIAAFAVTYKRQLIYID